LSNYLKKIVIIGAGPAGLTAAIELQKSGFTNITILESDNIVGGISRTVNHNGNRIDIGGHRFFSKSNWVMSWWADFLPIMNDSAGSKINLKYRGSSIDGVEVSDIKSTDKDSVMLVRNRLSRIYFNRNFFSYPLKLNVDTLKKLGFKKTFIFGFGYLIANVISIKPEISLQDFLINRFGKPLYLQFFKEYTEKVWGVSCSEISADWGSQRIKSLSILSAFMHALKSRLGLDGVAKQTSLIENFIYPKFGPGQMWETVSEKYKMNGGNLTLNATVSEIEIVGDSVVGVRYRDRNGSAYSLDCDVVISTMPIKDLVLASKDYFPKSIIKIASELQYRDFITVGLLYKKNDFSISLKDNWIYIQEPGVKVGRVQVFNNWSPYLVKDPETIWLGMEFFCKEIDPLWKMSNDELSDLAQRELLEIGLVNKNKASDSVVIKVPKAYPGYFGDAYREFDKLRIELDQIKNLFLIGRNGMHRYNNQDHSMLTAKEAANQIASGRVDKSKIWSINIDDEYHEDRK
jgi:protoporphyrinogen oxidase